MLRAGTGRRNLFGRGLVSPSVFAGIESLFAAGEKGWWYDPSDLSTLFQDAAGTTPVTAVGQPVGRVKDKSGNGNHLTATGTARPTLRQDASGFKYIEFDGIDDFLISAACTIGSPSYLASFIALAADVVTTCYLYSYGRIGSDAGTIGTSLDSANSRYSHFLKGPSGTAEWYDWIADGTDKHIITMLCDLAQGASVALSLAVREQNAAESGATQGFAPGVGTFGDWQICMGARSPGNYLSTSRNYGWVGRFAATNTSTQDGVITQLNANIGAY